jgi:hypothetical protein
LRDRHWLPRSECTIVPWGTRGEIALRSAATASWEVIRASKEYPTILSLAQSLIAQR